MKNVKYSDFLKFLTDGVDSATQIAQQWNAHGSVRLFMLLAARIGVFVSGGNSPQLPGFEFSRLVWVFQPNALLLRLALSRVYFSFSWNLGAMTSMMYLEGSTFKPCTGMEGEKSYHGPTQ